MHQPYEAAADPTVSSTEEQIYRKVTLRIIPFLFICYLAAYLDRVNVSFAKLRMLHELNFSEAVYGFGSGIFFLGYVLFEVPSNVIMLRVGARLWIARIMLTWGLISAAMIFVKTPLAFYILRFLLGVAEAGFIPGILLYLTYWYPAARRGKITAIFLAAIPTASIIGAPLSGWILSVVGDARGLSGWQWLFLIETIPSLVLGVVTLFYLSDRVADVHWLDAGEKQIVAANLARENLKKSDHSHLSQAFRDGRVWLLGAIYFAIACSIYIISFWVPSLIQQSGISDPLQIGILSAVPHAVAIIVMITVNTSADRMRERRWHTMVPGLAAGLGLCLTTLAAGNPVLTVFCLTVAAAGASAAQASFWCMPAAFLSGAAAAGGIALINSLGNVAGFTSTSVVGWVTSLTHSSASILYVFGAITIVGSAFLLKLPARLVNR